MPNIHIHYLHHALKRELSELYFISLIRGLGGGMLALFTPLYFFKEGWSMQNIIIWFAISYAIFVITGPIGANLIGRFGHEKTMAMSIPLSIIYYALLFYLPTNPAFFWCSAFMLGFMKSIYWIAYHAEFAASTDKKDAGEEVGFIRVLMSLVGIAAPAIGGYIVASFGFATMYLVGGTLISLSIIPLLRSKQKWTPTHIGYADILKLFKLKKLRRDLIGHIATGEDLAAQAIWPIWLFLIIPNYRDIGILTTITIFFTFIVMLWMGKLANRGKKSKLIKRSATGITFGWLARMFAFTPLTVFFADSIYKIAGKSMSIPYVALSYTRVKRKKIIEYTTFWMMSLSIGKLVAAALIYILLCFTDNLIYTFLISALLSLLFLAWQDSTK